MKRFTAFAVFVALVFTGSAARKTKAPVAVAAASISVESSATFPALLDGQVTDRPANGYVRVQCWAPDDPVRDDISDVIDYWITPNADGSFVVDVSPTRVWSGPAAVCRARLVEFAVAPNVSPVQTVVAETGFTVG